MGAHAVAVEHRGLGIEHLAHGRAGNEPPLAGQQRLAQAACIARWRALGSPTRSVRIRQAWYCR